MNKIYLTAELLKMSTSYGIGQFIFVDESKHGLMIRSARNDGCIGMTELEAINVACRATGCSYYAKFEPSEGTIIVRIY